MKSFGGLNERSILTDWVDPSLLFYGGQDICEATYCVSNKDSKITMQEGLPEISSKYYGEKNSRVDHSRYASG